MQENPPKAQVRHQVIGILLVFAVVSGLVDLFHIHTFHDSILPPAVYSQVNWTQLDDWSAENTYPTGWKSAALSQIGRLVSPAILTVMIVIPLHLLLWSGVFHAGDKLFRRSPWVALLGVAMVRIMPDLFQVDILSARVPSRLAAVGLVFWSMGFLVSGGWIRSCMLAALVTHFSPTVGIWYLQVMVVGLVCYDFGHGWRRSAIGAAVYLAIAAVPLTWFFVERIWPDPPIPPVAMIGLHFFADPLLSPFVIPLWAVVCLVVYVAMAFVWMKACYSRKTSPLTVMLLIFGFMGMLVEIVFVGLVPVERAARFELQDVRALWILWLALVYAPVLADEIGAAWRRQSLWRPVLRGMVFSLPVIWAATTLVERFFRPPKWNRILLGIVLVMLIGLAFFLPHALRPTGQAFWAIGIVLSISLASGVAGHFGRTSAARGIARAAALGAAAFLVVFALTEGTTVADTVAEVRRVNARGKAWTETCRWVRGNTPSTHKWAVPWRPRDFRRRTDRPVLVNRTEVPSDPSRRYEWFQRYAQTHAWEEGPALYGPSLSRDRIIRQLGTYRASFLMGASRRPRTPEDSLLISAALVRMAGVDHAIVDADSPVTRLDEGSSPTLSLKLEHTAPPFSVYAIHVSEAGRQ